MRLRKLIARNENLQVFLLIIFAYAFSVLCRFYWIAWASDFDEFFFNNALMIVSNDGYVFAEGARDMIAGFHQPNDLSFYGSPLSTITYVLYKITPFSFENIILYVSVFLSSLIVVPILLIAKEYKCLLMGFLAAMLASIAKSYYNRTMAGYYDTDMLAIVLPLFVLYFMIRLILRKDFVSLLGMPLFVGIYLWWYPSSYTLNVALIGLFFLYTLAFHRKEKLFYMAVILSALTLSNIAWFYQSTIIVLLFALFVLRQEYFTLARIGILGLIALVFLAFSGGIDPILYQLKFYIFRSDLSANLVQGFTYFNVNLTIQEVEGIGLEAFMQRISSSSFVFFISLAGLIWLIKEHKSFILALPMLALGFLALKGGLRFTIYAVPIMALGFGFFGVKCLTLLEKARFENLKKLRIYQLSSVIVLLIVLFMAFVIFQITLRDYELLQKELGIEASVNLSFISYILGSEILIFVFFAIFFIPLLCELIYQHKFKSLRSIFIIAYLSFALFFSLQHIYAYKSSSVFTQSEASELNTLKSIADREDYVIAWWDYGYPIRYYSDVKTLADGGKHLGKDNFFPSFVLTQDQIAAANMARLSVEYTEKSFKEPMGDLLQEMMKDYNQNNVGLFLDALNSKNFELKTPKTRDVYIYMPTRMALIFPTVASFSHIDLENGSSSGVFFIPGYFQDESKGQIYLSNGIILSNDFRYFVLDDKVYSLNSLVEFNSIRQNDYKIISIDENASLYLFYIKDSSVPLQFIIMDKKMYESAFVQMLFFGNYDKDLFELVLNSKDAKVFKLKR